MFISLLLLTAGCERQKPVVTQKTVAPGPPKPVPMRPDMVSGVGHRYKSNETQELLKGIVWDDKKPYAIIGPHVVVVGDYVDDKRVVKITQESVTLEADGQEEMLELQ